MTYEAGVDHNDAAPRQGLHDLKSDVAIVPRTEGASMVAFHLEDGQGSASYLLTQAQAEALSNALILAADRARFHDAMRPRRPIQRMRRA
ncbi:hypothetical protein [Alsobacter sp. R-9]